MAITIGEVFWLGVAAAVVALAASMFIAELPLRAYAGMDAPVATETRHADGSAAAGRVGPASVD